MLRGDAVLQVSATLLEQSGERLLGCKRETDQGRLRSGLSGHADLTVRRRLKQDRHRGAAHLQGRRAQIGTHVGRFEQRVNDLGDPLQRLPLAPRHLGLVAGRGHQQPGGDADPERERNRHQRAAQLGVVGRPDGGHGNHARRRRGHHHHRELTPARTGQRDAYDGDQRERGFSGRGGTQQGSRGQVCQRPGQIQQLVARRPGRAGRTRAARPTPTTAPTRRTRRPRRRRQRGQHPAHDRHDRERECKSALLLPRKSARRQLGYLDPSV